MFDRTDLDDDCSQYQPGLPPSLFGAMAIAVLGGILFVALVIAFWIR